jgi:membrane protein DedA with SNARE-associated domain
VTARVLPYLGILLAAIVEGEVAYVAACALVAAGRLEALPVVLAGATGAAIGDQAFFYVFRGRLPRWLARFPSIERKAAPLVAFVRVRAPAMVLLIRFAPGLRIAIAAACAYVGVSPVLFSVLNALTAVVWAVALLIVVAWAGPAALARFGLGGWKGALLVGGVIIALFALVGRRERTSMGA